jgi:ATP-binding cassette subfamily F protein 3
MVSKDILKNALIRFNGTLIVVSHDRDFLQGLTDRVYEFRNKKIKEYKGDVYNFLEQRKLDSLDALNKKKLQITPGNKNVSNNKSKDLWLKKKEYEKKLRKISNSVKQCELEIHDLEQELEKMNRVLKNPQENNEKINEMDIFTKYDVSKTKLEEKMNQWETLQLELEELQNKKPV